VGTAEGLRERKKAATRRALHEAAVQLAVARGFDGVTVEAIADAASVSRRTFSNYFAGKEQALLYGDETRIALLLDRVRARPQGEPPWTALSLAADELYRELGEPDPEWVARSTLIRRHPALVAQQIAAYTGVERELAAEVAARSGDAAAALRVRVVAATFLGALRVATHVWLDQPGRSSLAEVVQEALREAGDAFG
jgi:AcrR family transcriptional regulator